MVEQDQAAGVGAGAHGRADLLREQEAGAAVGDGQDRVPVQLAQQGGPVAGVDQREDRVGVGVGDAGGRDEGVQERLDRGAGRGRLHERVGQVVDHLLVAEVVALEERQDVVESDAGEVLPPDGREVGA